MTKKPLLILAVCAALLLLLAAAPANATPESPLQTEVDRLLALTPEGTQVDEDTIVWDDGAVIVNVALGTGRAARAIANCPTGYYCAWTAAGYLGSSIWLTSCSAGGTSSSLTPLGSPARSLANARTSGTVNRMNGATVVDTLTASSGRSSVSGTTTAMVCFT